MHVSSESYVVIGPETGGIGRDEESRDRFLCELNVKVGRVVLDSLFLPRQKIYSYL
jgi:hypothetical protein